jgi:hypothetical protein
LHDEVCWESTFILMLRGVRFAVKDFRLFTPEALINPPKGIQVTAEGFLDLLKLIIWDTGEKVPKQILIFQMAWSRNHPAILVVRLGGGKVREFVRRDKLRTR